MRMLLICGVAGIVAGGALAFALDGWLRAMAALLALAALVPMTLGLSMIVYGLVGKRRMRDFMIGRIDWRGDEHVLVIGAGRGLLLIGAAKKLRDHGRATGIDIWRLEDLSDNTLDNLRSNVVLEGVEDRVVLMTEDARKLSFADGKFDVVFSLFCIHNTEDKSEQRAACLEIARVLKPGGRTLIGEWLPTHRYAAVFREAGLKVHSSRSFFGKTLSLMWMVEAEKPAA